MTFLDWKQEIQRRSMAFGGPVRQHDEKDVDRVLAAAASVIAEKGSEWALENPKVFQTHVLKKIGTWMSLGFFVLRILGFSNPFLMVASWILPVVVNWLQEHISLESGAFSASDWQSIGQQAEAFARSMK